MAYWDEYVWFVVIGAPLLRVHITLLVSCALGLPCELFRDSFVDFFDV
jgi:hypothetical protein